MTSAFTLISCIHGYHIYKDIWNAPVGETVVCERESRNARDPFVVALWKERAIVGHVPHTISCMRMQFLRNGGTIISTVTRPKKVLS